MSKPTPVEEFVQAIIVQACEDYRTALKWDDIKSIREIERFFRSKWYGILTSIDGEYLIAKLRKEHKEMSKGYFLLIDPQKNTLRIPMDDEFIHEMFRDREIKNNIKQNKTKRELHKDVADYLNGGER